MHFISVILLIHIFNVAETLFSLMLRSLYFCLGNFSSTLPNRAVHANCIFKTLWLSLWPTVSLRHGLLVLRLCHVLNAPLLPSRWLCLDCSILFSGDCVSLTVMGKMSRLKVYGWEMLWILGSLEGGNGSDVESRLVIKAFWFSACRQFSLRVFIIHSNWLMQTVLQKWF